MSTGITETQQRLVLRRAAEIEREARSRSENVDLDVREIAREVGIEEAAVEQALAELDAGTIEVAEAEPGVLDRMVGPATVHVERWLPATPQTVRGAIDAFLGNQLLRVARRQGARTLFRADESLWSQTKRMFDVTNRYELPIGSTVESWVMPEAEGCKVRFVLRLEEPRRERARGLIFGVLAAVGVGAAGVALADPLVWDAVSVAAGGGIAAMSVGRARGGQKKDVASAREALERFLDHVVPGGRAVG